MVKETKSVQKQEIIMGAKALGEQIIKTMPTYPLLLEQIENMRKIASQFDSYQNSEFYEEPNRQVFINTVGIFGPRGTGKSSALYTLRAELLKAPQENILLPLIEPDNFGDNTKIIGSIVGLLCSYAQSLLKKLSSYSQIAEKLPNYFLNGNLKPNNPLKQVIDKTIEYHLYTEKQYRDMLVQNNFDLPEHIRKSERLLVPDIEFRKQLNSLVNQIIEVHQTIFPGENEKAVLIYIFIDDIDLKTAKTRELMDALMQYTDHPNIVTVLSGDYEILTESLTLALLRDEPLSAVGLNAFDTLKIPEYRYSDRILDINGVFQENIPLTILKRKTELAHEYLKKTIPPAARHQLVKWSIETIPNFSVGTRSLIEQLKSVLGNQSIFSYEKNADNEKTDHPIAISYKIFDDRPRGIINVYRHLNQIQLAYESDDIPEATRKFQLVKGLIDTIVLSNTLLLEHQNIIFSQFLLWGSDISSTAIRYDILQEHNKESLFLPLYVIGEMVCELLDNKESNINRNNDEVFNFKQKMLHNLLKRPIDLSLEDVRWDEKNFVPYPLFFLMQALTTFSTPKLSLILVDQLLRNKVDTFYYKNRWSDSNARLKDQKIIEIIESVLKIEEEMNLKQQGSNLLINLYEQSSYALKEESKDLANFAVALLQEMSTVAEFVATIERQFKPFLDQWDAKLNEIYEELYSKERYGISMDNILTRNLFVNFLNFFIERNFEENHFKDRSKSKISSLLEKVSKESEKDTLPQAILQSVDTAVQLYAESFFKRINVKIRSKNNDSVVKLDIPQTEVYVLEAFHAGYSGQTDTTYNKAQRKVETAFGKLGTKQANYTEYREAYEAVLNLSENNRVWYGRQEAVNFLPYLRNNSQFVNEFFDLDELYTLQLYNRYIKVTLHESKYNEYEMAKKYIKEKLDSSIKFVTSALINESERYGLQLQDFDPDVLNEKGFEPNDEKILDLNLGE